MQTLGDALTSFSLNLLLILFPLSLFLSSQVAFSTHGNIPLKGEKRSCEVKAAFSLSVTGAHPVCRTTRPTLVILVNTSAA